ncbi:MAG: hypothetical protein ABT940_10465 [Alphaproteobacteria bacterium]
MSSTDFPEDTEGSFPSGVASSARRCLLVVSANPDRSRDYAVTLSGVIRRGLLPPSPPWSGAFFRLRYVPDRWILSPESLVGYLEVVGTTPWSSLEHLASVLADDLRNELIPRWMLVQLGTGSPTSGHEVMIEDRQPRWDNRGLLSSLSRFSHHPVWEGASLPPST